MENEENLFGSYSDISPYPRETRSEKKEKITQEQVFDLITGEELSWQAIIYDLINSEQLDPWDIDIVLLTSKYLGKIQELEEVNFQISSKVLLAAAILLRIKSEILLNIHLRSLDEILFGKEEEKKYEAERIIIDESELPELIPRTPLPRQRKVSLQELMSALNNAINTETRRIEREVRWKVARRQADMVLPKMGINIKDRIRHIYAKIQTMFRQKKTKISYTELIGNKRDERIACFLPVLHLDNQQKVFLEQEKHLEEVYIWLYSHYKKMSEQKEEVKEEIEQVAEQASLENPMAGFFDSLEN